MRLEGTRVSRLSCPNHAAFGVSFLIYQILGKQGRLFVSKEMDIEAKKKLNLVSVAVLIR